MKKILVFIVSFMLVATPVLADGGQILDGRWLCTNIDGSVTEETPAELKDNFDLYINKPILFTERVGSGLKPHRSLTF